MCGIIGYIGGKKQAAPVVHRGLTSLEYRGYDSSGIALLNDDGEIEIFRALGAPSETFPTEDLFDSYCGMGHTRWATHGGVTLENTHPHHDKDKNIYLVHNGVFENSDKFKKILEQEGYEFYGETDSEILVNLISYYYSRFNNTPLEALKLALKNVEGTYGLVVIFKSDEGNVIYGARKSSPLVIGVGDDEQFIASDTLAIPQYVKRVVYLEDGQIVELSKTEFNIHYLNNSVSCSGFEKTKRIKNRKQDAELGEYTYFMEKEIFEQPNSIRDSLRGRLSPDFESIRLGGVDLSKEINRIQLIGCGTAYCAGLLGKYYLENIAGIPASVEYASEYKYKSNPTEDGTLAIAITQSGETLDTLGAIQEAKMKGLNTMAITNVVGSTISREVDEGIYQRVGPEISVASTKAFTSQVALLLMLAVSLAGRSHLNKTRIKRYISEVRRLPQLIEETLTLAPRMKKLAAKFQMSSVFDFLGRQYMYPIALEGALKLKELTYLNCHGYPSGEVKHGPLATMSGEKNLFFLAPQRSLKDKNLSNIRELKSRGARIVLMTQEGVEFERDCYDNLITLPPAPDYILPILSVIPLQLFSMYMAVFKRCNVDKPRNLAKSVTVE
jgi:glucosamine--fructose-6-phosphate aminotransferase (isomerizing)